MKTFSAFEAKKRFGRLLDTAQRGPITVTKRGRPTAVMISVEDYERMRGTPRRRLLETIDKIQRRAGSKWLSHGKLEQLLDDKSRVR